MIVVKVKKIELQEGQTHFILPIEFLKKLGQHWYLPKEHIVKVYSVVDYRAKARALKTRTRKLAQDLGINEEALAVQESLDVRGKRLARKVRKMWMPSGS